ncbi:hypothetical protein [Moorena sp. SIO4G3]|uniref:hypothetical protein n=1 Tax=Moorena sp. SIO4G3 TaxID=2607821 RepID=UPI001429DB19|nr:hypothetical protein [Moorena sp. SIO4G3]NEO80047.1 hypothetical protein [Moorena sp. SIO4G3]
MKNTQRQIHLDKTQINKLRQLQPLELEELEVIIGGRDGGGYGDRGFGGRIPKSGANSCYDFNCGCSCGDEVDEVDQSSWWSDLFQWF